MTSSFSSNRLITIDTTTGVGTVVGTGSADSITFDPRTNELYGKVNDGALMTIDPATGDETIVTPVHLRLSRGIEFIPTADNDCNTNGVPDDCDLPGDLSGDAVVDVFDIPDFVSNILGGVRCRLADVNGDGAYDGLDVSAFVDVLAG